MYRKFAACPRSARGRERLAAAPQPPVRGDDRRECARRWPRASSAASESVPAAMRSASIGSTSARGAVAQQRERRRRQRARGCEVARETRRARAARRQIAVPQQPGGLLERGVLRELVDAESRAMISSPRSPSTWLSARRRGDHAFESAVAHDRTLAPVYDRVNVDWTINMSDGHHAWIGAAEAAAMLGVSRADAVRVRQPRLRPLAGDCRAVAGTPLLARRRRAAAAAHRGAPRPGQGGRARAAVGHADPRVVDHADRRHAALLPRPRRGGAGAHALARGSRRARSGRGNSTRAAAGEAPAGAGHRPARRGMPFVARAQSALALAARARSARRGSAAGCGRARRLADPAPADARRRAVATRHADASTRRWRGAGASAAAASTCFAPR